MMIISHNKRRKKTIMKKRIYVKYYIYILLNILIKIIIIEDIVPIRNFNGGTMNTLDIITNLNILNRQCEMIFEPLKEKYQLSFLEIKILDFLNDNPDFNIAQEIANFRLLSKSKISEAITSLEAKKLLNRQKDNKDHRKIHIYLSNTSKKIIQDIIEVKQQFISQLFKDFKDEEIADYQQYISRIINNSKDITPELKGSC